MSKTRIFTLPSPYGKNGNPAKYVTYDWDKWIYDDKGNCVYEYSHENGGLESQIYNILKD